MNESRKALPESTENSKPTLELPERELSLRDLFNRFLEEDLFGEPFDFTQNTRLASLFNRQFLPRVDISETDSHVKVIADLPGVTPENMAVDVEGDRMRISGSTQRETEAGEKPYRYERTYGEFRREFTLPSSVRKEGIKAVYKDGLLTVTIPKAGEERKNRIQIERQ